MSVIQDIDAQVLAILAETLQKPMLEFDEPLDMSSIQILTALACIERTFGIEVEDEDVFHGLFSSAKYLSTFVHRMVGLSKDDGWLLE